MKKIIKKVKELSEDLDKPAEIKFEGFFKRGKYRIIIVYEDNSYKEFFVKIKAPYIMKVKGRDYLINPKCIVKGKNPMLIYYFNNPFPVMLEYRQSKLTALDMADPKFVNKLNQTEKENLAMIKIDTEGIHSAFSSNLIKRLYEEKGFLTVRNIIIIAVVFLIISVIILHATGVIDIRDLLGLLVVR